MEKIVEQIYNAKGLYSDMLKRVARKYGLTNLQLMLIMFICESDKPSNSCELVKRYNLKKAAVSIALSKIEQMGYISTLPSKTDKRLLDCYANPSAYPIAAKGKALQEEYCNILVKGFDEDEKQELLSILAKVDDNVNSAKL